MTIELTATTIDKLLAEAQAKLAKQEELIKPYREAVATLQRKKTALMYASPTELETLLKQFPYFKSRHGHFTVLHFRGTVKYLADILSMSLFGEACEEPYDSTLECLPYLGEFEQFECKRGFYFKKIRLDGHVSFTEAQKKILKEYLFEFEHSDARYYGPN